MVLLDFPTFEYRWKKTGDKVFLFDVIRKKYVVLTPEEWVRQHLIHYLIAKKNYPKTLIKIESGLAYNNLPKRSDVVVFDRKGSVFITIECKAPHVKLNQSTIDQVAVYNKQYKSKFLAITNGLQHLVFEMDYRNKQHRLTGEYPDFT